MPRKKPVTQPTVDTEPRYYCTACGDEAMIRYSAGKDAGQDWGGKVHQGEAICTACMRKRRDPLMFGR